MEEKEIIDTEFADSLAALAGVQDKAPEPTKEPEQPEYTEQVVTEQAEESQPDDKPETQPPKNEEVVEQAEESEPEQPKMYAGRFKSLEDFEKGYQELQKAFTQKSQQAKEIIENFSSPDDLEKNLAQAIEADAMKRIETAVSMIQDPEHLKEASAAVAMYRRTGDVAYIEKATGFLDRTTERRLDREMYNAAAEIKQHYLSKRDEIELEPIKEQLVEMHKEDPDWVLDENNQRIMDLTISLNRKVDLREIKRMIQDVGTRAVEKYKAQEAAKVVKNAAKAPNVSLAAGGRTPPPPPPKSEDEMTTAEYLQSQYAKLGK